MNYRQKLIKKESGEILLAVHLFAFQRDGKCELLFSRSPVPGEFIIVIMRAIALWVDPSASKVAESQHRNNFPKAPVIRKKVISSSNGV